jgi:hypothetical protein
MLLGLGVCGGLRVRAGNQLSLGTKASASCHTGLGQLWSPHRYDYCGFIHIAIQCYKYCCGLLMEEGDDERFRLGMKTKEGGSY